VTLDARGRPVDPGGEPARTSVVDDPEIVPAPSTERLLEAAAEAFAERGYHATSTRDIAARAGMSPAALYVHFAAKEALLFELSLVGHQAALDVVREAAAVEAGAIPSAQLAAIVSSFAAWHAEHRRTARVVQYELAALTPEHRAVIAALRREIESSVRDVVEAGVREGEFEVEDVRGTVLAILSLAIDVARWYRIEGRRTPAEVGALYAELALRMVAAL
jgi:AcrR family transcriptional regulator